MFQEWIMMRFPPYLRPNDQLGYDVLPPRTLAQALPVHLYIRVSLVPHNYMVGVPEALFLFAQ